MMGRYIGKRMKKFGAGAPFEFIKDDLKKADIVFGNLASMRQNLLRGSLDLPAIL